MVRKEGGSGVFKIAKILAVDLQRNPGHMGYVIEDRHFTLEISMDPSGVIV